MSHIVIPHRFLTLAAGSLLASILVGISSFYYAAQVDAATQAAVPPAPSVDVVVMTPQSVRTWANYSGRLVPVESAAIKPLVGGTIQQVLFEEGQQIKKGQPLFMIDPRPHQAALQGAQAQLATAQSRARLTQDELKRASQLIGAKLVSQSLYDAAVSASQVAQAEVKQAEAAVNKAQINLDYAHVVAPISGRVGRAELTVGNVVDAGINAPVLTQVVSNDKLYVDFNVDEASYIQLLPSVKSGQKMPVDLTLLGGDSVAPHRGYISAFDNHFDTASGTIRARAIFDNKDGDLTAGMFAKVRVGSANESGALLIPERAIGTNQSKKFVMVVDANNIATYREVSLGDHYEGQRLVLSGLNAGDKVIVNGLSHVRPQTPVAPNVIATPDAIKVASNP